MRCRRYVASVAISVLTLCASAFASDTAPRIGPDSHQPVPRFVSLKTVGANGRHGPGLEHKVDWIYERAGLPLLVTAESGRWRRVRDPDGAEVWIYAANLDDRRTGYVKGADDVPLRDAPQAHARIVAYLAPGVVGSLTGCDSGWRRMAVGGRVGWVPKAALWGADEVCAAS
ncbi:MAG TPA: SH3 domain-containing protein [Caulobacterales bacterium]|nr:SH3 domain-containing protein [Caulobacterales bacterium]